MVFCVAVVEPAERDLGRKLIRDCPAQEALQEFLQSESGGGGGAASSSAGSVSTNCRSPSGFCIYHSAPYRTRVAELHFTLFFSFSVSKLGDLVAAELSQREDSSGRLSQTSPPQSPKKPQAAEVAPASNESGYKSSPNPSDPGRITISTKYVC